MLFPVERPVEYITGEWDFFIYFFLFIFLFIYFFSQKILFSYIKKREKRFCGRHVFGRPLDRKQTVFKGGLMGQMARTPTMVWSG